MGENTASTLRRGIHLLEHLSAWSAQGRGGLGAAELARLAGVERSAAFRTLQALSELGLVERDPESLSFRPGWRLFRLASGAAADQLRSLAPAFLERLTGLCGESSYLSVRERHHVLTTFTARSFRVIQSVDWTGLASPLTCTSAGIALLLDHGADELELLLGTGPYESPTPASPRDLPELLERIETGRESGIVVSDGEFEPGLLGIAGPVRDFSGRIVASVDISGPEYRLRHRIDELTGFLRTETGRLSLSLGHEPAGRGAELPVAVAAGCGK